MSAANYKFFENSDAVVGYIESELLATLQNDLDRMENEEEEHYEDEDRADMRNRIADIEQFFATHEFRPKR